MGSEGLLDAALSRVLRLDPDAARRLGELHGKVILLEIAGEGTPLRLYVIPSAAGVRIARRYDGLPDVTITGTVAVFVNQLARGPTVSDALVIRGDIELGQRFQRIASAFAPDWEEVLARVIGDVPGHQIGRMVRAFFGWSREALQTLGTDSAEYLQEEAFVLAKRARVEAFLRDVDRLRADADRLHKRIERLAGGQ
jgi:ubiquinone biosynthesis protein UbiJ